MTSLTPADLLILLLGPAAGSFLGVFVDRWPRGRSLWDPSACAACGTRLRWRDMVPLFSALRGRCRVCGAAIPGHLARIEWAALGAAALAVALGAGPAQTAALAVWLWCLTGLFYADLTSFRLPDPLTAVLALSGLAFACVTPGRGLAEGLISAAAGVAAFWAIREGYRRLRGREGLGLGDVKMMAGIGAGLGWSALPLVALVAAGLALAVAGLEAVRQGALPSATARLPFGAYLAGASVLVLMLSAMAVPLA